MSYCPCCSTRLLRHVSRNRVYWFCPSCHQEMPELSSCLVNKLNRLAKSSHQESKLLPEVAAR